MQTESISNYLPGGALAPKPRRRARMLREGPHASRWTIGGNFEKMPKDDPDGPR